jgi:hypothetical protein
MLDEKKLMLRNLTLNLSLISVKIIFWLIIEWQLMVNLQQIDVPASSEVNTSK